MVSGLFLKSGPISVRYVVRRNKTRTSKVGAISKAQKAQNICFGKKFEILELFSFKKCRTVPQKIQRRDPLGTSGFVGFLEKVKKWKRGPFALSLPWPDLALGGFSTALGGFSDVPKKWTNQCEWRGLKKKQAGNGPSRRHIYSSKIPKGLQKVKVLVNWGPFYEKKFWKKSHNAEKNWKGGPFGIFQYPFCRKISKKWRGTLRWKFLFRKKSHRAENTLRE